MTAGVVFRGFGVAEFREDGSDLGRADPRVGIQIKRDRVRAAGERLDAAELTLRPGGLESRYRPDRLNAIEDAQCAERMIRAIREKRDRQVRRKAALVADIRVEPRIVQRFA
mgnify:CR=1 FL=1